MKTKELLPREYAKLMKCTEQNITKHIRNGHKLPYVKEIKTFSRFVILVVDSTIKPRNKKSKLFKKRKK